ncbi:DUF6228 family protein [Streptomyces liangshanensis]|uniref:DUF6228 family protein n=1 Tax=Streptomyces liangshanensis TaxID=2717324 RepID=UPI0031332D5D
MRDEEGAEGRPQVSVGGGRSGAVRVSLSEPTRPFPEDADDPMLDFVVRARGEWVSVEVSVRTMYGDGLDGFLAKLAEGLRGWDGSRTWRSLERDLTLSATHGSGGYVRLTWGLHGGPASDNGWRFEATTVHAAGEDMRRLAAEVGVFLRGGGRT